MGVKPATRLHQKALSQELSDRFWVYSDSNDQSKQETFQDFQSRARVVKDIIDRFDIKLVPVGNIRAEFEQLVEYTNAFCSPRIAETVIVRSLSAGSERFLPAKPLQTQSEGEEVRGYFADAILDILKRAKKTENQILFAVTKSPIFVGDRLWTDCKYDSEDQVCIISLYGCLSDPTEYFTFVSRCIYSHIFKMVPCHIYKCLMNQRSVRLCPLCLRRLSVMASGAGHNYDFVERYRKLGEVYSKYIPHEVSWVNERCMSITGSFVLPDSYETAGRQEGSSSNGRENFEGYNIQGHGTASGIQSAKNVGSQSFQAGVTVDKSKLKCLKRKIRKKS